MEGGCWVHVLCDRWFVNECLLVGCVLRKGKKNVWVRTWNWERVTSLLWKEASSSTCSPAITLCGWKPPTCSFVQQGVG